MGAHRFNTERVCCRQIRFELNEGELNNVMFLGGGCEGNLKALSVLAEGMDAQELANKLKGTMCGRRGTSCSDQLARAIEAAMKKEASEQASAS
ncbi:MAG: TIGR03905 family TSCPD domain-containing protein [Eggerthellaceae bacterium]|nr:TIGR03905 family TSCPD domain-containing protein [Eggerthellaceae bacterium]